MIISTLLLSLIPNAQAVPLQITQQGRINDSSGQSLEGSQFVVFRIYDAETGGNVLWDEILTVQFTNGYAACAVCSPTRAAVQTGRYPHRLGVTDWIRSLFQRGGLGTPEKNPTEYIISISITG